MHGLRILVLTQFYSPEVGAAPARLSYLARHLAASGHTVTVLTALPNHPGGHIFDGYRGRLLAQERQGLVGIIRTWLYTTNSKGFIRRIANYCTFSLMALLVGSVLVGQQDFVVVESPPLFVGISGFLISRFKRARLCLNISDLWPKSAIVLGMVRNPVLIRWSTRLEEFLYRKAHLITAQTRGIVDDIVARCRNRTVEWMPNGVDIEEAPADPGARTRTRAALGIEGKFTVGYTGLFGLAQGLPSAIHAAARLAKFPEILFLLVGEGPEKPNLEKLAEEAGLSNVRFLAAQPATQMPELFQALDLALVPLKNHPLFHGALPSKLFHSMGAGLPVVGSVEGEARAVIEESQGGICVEPENSEQLAEAILKLYRDPDLRRSLGENGRRYVATHYNRAITAVRFEQLLVSTLEAAGSPGRWGRLARKWQATSKT